MKVLLVNTSDSIGGAAVACRRLMDALTRNGVEVRMLVRDKATDDDRVVSVSAPWQKAVERVMLLPFVGFSWRRSWTIDVNWFGVDITKTEAFQWADVIHLHWVNQGFLSIEQIGKIMRSGKKVVWTMHDLWPLESIWHYGGPTPTLPRRGGGKLIAFLEKQTFRRKQKNYKVLPPHFGEGWGGASLPPLSGRAGVGLLVGLCSFVTCSRWLMNQVSSSKLLEGHTICSIPNPIDTSLYYRKDKREARRRLGLPTEKRLILFVSQKLTDERKGARYFIEAVNQIENVAVAVLGSHGEDIAQQLKHETNCLGYVSEQGKISDIYNAADVFVLPSLNDNLPNTIMEAMACGVPCVGFDIGGIPEMIDDKVNGVIAEPRNVAELAEGIEYCLSEENHEKLSDACLKKVAETYSQAAVATRFKELYGGKSER